MLEALALWWEISLDPDSRVRDARFTQAVEQLLTGGPCASPSEPRRGSTWALRMERGRSGKSFARQRLSAAHDGKHIKATLERSLALDPDLHDADFGVDVYRYYADIAPATIRLLRWLFLLPGGDRQGGFCKWSKLANADRSCAARPTTSSSSFTSGTRTELQTHWPRARAAGPLPAHSRCSITSKPRFTTLIFHDAAASYAASLRLLALAEARHCTNQRSPWSAPGSTWPYSSASLAIAHASRPADRTRRRASGPPVRIARSRRECCSRNSEQALNDDRVLRPSLGDHYRSSPRDPTCPIERRVALEVRASCVLVGEMRASSASNLTPEPGLRLRRQDTGSQSFDKQPRFVLDIAIFSPIIYIWYEGGTLRQRLVNT